jgi:CelD/BcsL family acetyltransferase involved in cellulose biosynthesis
MKTETTFPLFLAPSRAATSLLRSEIVTDFDQLLSLEDAWSELEGQSSAATVFQSLPWIRAWWQAFGKNLQLSTIVVRDGTSVVGILPLLRNGKYLRFVGTPGADYCDCLCVEEMGPEVLATALRTLLKMDGWHVCRFGNLQKRSQLVRYLRDLPEEILDHLSLSPIGRQSSLILTDERDRWIADMRRKPGLKRHRNKLYRSGEVRFRHLETREEAHSMLRTLFEQHIYRRAMAGEYSQFLSSRWREFYTALVDELDLREHLRFTVLELDDKVVACHLGFQSRRSLILYKPTFDIDSWELSPGDVLLSELLGYAGERGLDEVDFTIGIEQYKEHFTNYSSDIFCATLDHSSVSASLRHLAEPVTYFARSYAPKRFVQRSVCRLENSLANGKQFLNGYGPVVVYRAPDQASQNPAVSQSQVPTPVQPRAATLTDLVSLAIHQPTPLNAPLLQEYRIRLRAGDRCYVLENGDSQNIAWIRRISLPDGEAPGTFSHSNVLYEFRSTVTQQPSPLDAGTVQWFLSHARCEGTLACICLSRFDRKSREVMTENSCYVDRDLNRIVRNAIWHR